MPNQPVNEVVEITASPEALGIPVEYVQPVAEPGQEAPRIMLFAEYSHVEEIAPEPEPEPEAIPQPAAPAAAVVEPQASYIPEPEPVVEVQPEPVPVSESHLILTKPPGTPIPFQFKPLSDPRVVPGASRVVVFQRPASEPPKVAPAPTPTPAPAPAAPPPEPPLSALEEFFRQPAPTPAPVEAAPVPAPAPTQPAPPPLPRVQRPYLKEVRVIQGNSTVVRSR